MTIGRSWTILAWVVAGYAFGAALAAQFGSGLLEGALPILGAAAGFAIARAIGGSRPGGPRGQLKYWRGRSFYDDE